MKHKLFISQQAHARQILACGALFLGGMVFQNAFAQNLPAAPSSIGLQIARNDNAPGGDPQRLKKNLEMWRNMSPEEQARIKQQRENFERLSPEEKQRLREEFKAQHRGQG